MTGHPHDDSVMSLTYNLSALVSYHSLVIRPKTAGMGGKETCVSVFLIAAVQTFTVIYSVVPNIVYVKG